LTVVASRWFDSVEVREHEDVEQFGAGSGAQGIQTVLQAAFELVRVRRRVLTNPRPCQGFAHASRGLMVARVVG
jgi:hypothetical protein